MANKEESEQEAPRLFSCRGNQVLRYHIHGFLTRIWLLALPGAVMICYGGVVLDMRFVIAGLIVILIMIPLVMQFVSLKCLSSPWSRVNLTPKTIEFTEEGIKMTAAEGFPPLPKNTVAWQDVRKVESQGEFVVLRLSGSSTSCLILKKQLLDRNELDKIVSLDAALDCMA